LSRTTESTPVEVGADDALVGGRLVLVGNRCLLSEAGIDSVPLTAVQETLASDEKMPMFAAAAMALSSLSVVANANGLRGMSLDPAVATGSFEHDGHTYYFCSQHCAESFAANPDTYVSVPTVR